MHLAPHQVDPFPDAIIRQDLFPGRLSGALEPGVRIASLRRIHDDAVPIRQKSNGDAPSGRAETVESERGPDVVGEAVELGKDHEDLHGHGQAGDANCYALSYDFVQFVRCGGAIGDDGHEVGEEDDADADGA